MPGGSAFLRKLGLVLAGPLVLVVAWVAYTAARHLVFWSPTEAIGFNSGDIRLAGTLIKPGGAEKYPIVVMLHGAGPDAGDGAANRASAKALMRHGFAVLIYNKRGTGASGGDFETAVYGDFIADAIAAVQYLAGRADIDGDQIGLFGASESGWFTPEIAAVTHDVAFIVNKAGPPLSWIETVLWEVRNEFLAAGVAELDLDTLLALTLQKWNYLRAAAVDSTFAVGPERAALEAAVSEVRATVPLADKLFDERLPPYDAKAYRRFANYSYDPASYLREIDIPMLYIFGELDVNVPTAESVAYLESLRQEHDKKITIRVLSDVGHVLYTWRGLLEAGYPPGYLDFLGSWAAQQLQPD